MNHKYNRSRNTFSVSRDNFFTFTNQCSQLPYQVSSHSLSNFSNPQKTSISLKLLQKLSEKMFQFNEQFYDSLIKNQSDCNSILSRTTVGTKKQIVNDKIEDNNSSKFEQIKEEHLKRAKNANGTDRLISSWTAFENLDITYKNKEQELRKQNLQLRKNVQKIEKKIKNLYYSVGEIQASELNSEDEPKSPIQKSTQSNMERILTRIKEHKVLIQKLKQKIENKRNQSQEYKQVYSNLLKLCGQKYGDKSCQLLVKFFQGEVTQNKEQLGN